MGLTDKLDDLEAQIAGGRAEAALQRLAQIDSSSVRDADVHLRMADIAEALGDGQRLLQELHLARRHRPDDPALLRRLAGVLADSGRMSRAVRCLRRAADVAPSDADVWEELGALLSQMGRQEEALDVYQKAFHLTGEPRFRALAGSLHREEEPEESKAPGEAFVLQFVGLFSGRDGVYARQWVSPRGETGYSPINEPFTPRVARNHLVGNYTVGAYTTRQDNTVRFLALDLDLARSLVARTRPDAASRSEAMGRLSDYALGLRTLAQEVGLPAYLEDSGSKGRHLWIFFGAPVPAAFARTLGKLVLGRAGPPPESVTVEVFPKQNSIPPNSLGNLIKLPLGIHRVTGRWAVFLDPAGSPVEDAEVFLHRVERVPPEGVREILARDATPWLDPEPLPPPEEEPVSRVLRLPEPEYHLETDDQVQRLFTGCSVLRTLSDKAEGEGILEHAEVQVLTYTLGHLPTGPQAVNALLRRCPGHAQRYLGRPQRGMPMSCAKIRKRIPEVTSGLPCDCPFAPDLGIYPHPLLHLASKAVDPDTDLGRQQLQALLSDYLRVRRELDQLTRRLQIYQERLHAWFEASGVEELDLPMGRLRRRPGPDGAMEFEMKV